MMILMMMMMMTVQKTSCHEVSVCKLNLRIDKLVNVTVTSRNTVQYSTVLLSCVTYVSLHVVYKLFRHKCC